MRMLTEQEVSLVAGGTSSSDFGYGDDWWIYDASWYGSSYDDDSAIVVTGHRQVWEPNWFWLVNPPAGPDTGGGGGGGTGGETPPVAKETPCVEAAPSSCTLQDLNNLALAASNEIAAGDDEGREFGVIFYTLDGVLGETPIFTNVNTESPDSDIDWNRGLALVPDGAVIVGMLHNHPDISGIVDTIPSYNNMTTHGQDWTSYDSFQRLNSMDYRGIHADPNMLMYIYSNEDHKTHVYDKTDHNQTSPSCSLQD